MIKGIFIFLAIVIALIIIDNVMAFFRPGLQGIPFFLAGLLFAEQKRDFRKRIVKINHDMTAEELIASTTVK